MSSSEGGLYGAGVGTMTPLRCTCCKNSPLRIQHGVLVCDVCDLPNEMLIERVDE